MTTTNDELNDDGDCSLREAVRAANTDLRISGCAKGSGADTIVLRAATYRFAAGLDGDDDTAEKGDLDLMGVLTIRGAGAQKTFVNGNDLDRVFQVLTSADVTILRLAVKDGLNFTNSVTGGAGILNSGTLTLTSASLVSNQAAGSNQGLGNGGGLFNESGATAILRGVTVTENQTSWGGGGIFSGGTLTLTRSTVSSNSGHDGGGLAAEGTTTISTTTFSGNATGTTGYGGGISHGGGTFTLTRSTISGNNSVSGDGLYNASGTVSLANVTLSGNGVVSASGNGGGIFNSSSGTSNLSNVTLLGNSAGGTNTGGNIWNDGIANVENTILADPVAGSSCRGAGTYNDQGNNLESGSDCTVAADGDPLLGPLQNNGGPTKTHALGAASDALNAGADCEEVDQRGVPRPQGPACDIGALERALCLGRVVNRVGTQGNDRMVDGAGDHVYLTLGGRDFVRPGAGADRVCLGAGNDTADLRDGSGTDRAAGQAGRDRVLRNPGDVVRGFELF
ncbi:MAG: CSLREA domain-containing protein [Gaiellaceae bacterium]